MKYTLAHYDACLSKLKDVFASIQGVYSIMQFGSINAPGNSDIDLIFVIEEDGAVYQEVLQEFEIRFTNEEKFLIYQHQPYFVPESVIDKINVIRPCSNIRTLYGKDYPIQNTFGIYHNIYLLVELLTNYYPTYLTSFSNVRVNLQIINAFRYLFDIYEELASHFGLNTSFAGEVRVLLKNNNDIRRAEGVSLEEIHGFIEMSRKKLFNVVFEMLDQIDNMLGEYIERKHIPSGPIVYRGKVFSEKKKRLYVFKFLGRTFNLMHYPRNFYYIFGEPENLMPVLRESVEERNESLYEYQRFCSKCTVGTHFYLPWWITWEANLNNRFKMVFLNAISII